MNEQADPNSGLDRPAERFVEGVDYYFEHGLMVMTAHYLTQRGYCCHNDCRHCPYDENGQLK
ncbi:MAG: DUF5522 domain-containing protein [Acidobacteriota bacterium]